MNNILNEIKTIALRFSKIKKIILFGSRARKDNTNFSDYDIAVFAEQLDDREKESFLSEIDDVNTLNKIDIIFIDKRHINTEIYKNIMKEGITIVDKFQIKLNNYNKALLRLHEAIEEVAQSESLTVRDGAIQRFEFTAELAWKTMREYLILEEVTDINSPKNVLVEAYKNKLITNDIGWLQLLRDRNSTSHIYDETDATEIYKRISTIHVELFDELSDKLND